MAVYIKIILNDYSISVREQREAKLASEIGFDVKIVSRNIKTSKNQNFRTEHYEVQSLVVNTKGKHGLDRLSSLISSGRIWIRTISRLKPNIISCSTLTGLMLAYLSRFQIRNGRKTKLIYNSNECEVWQVPEKNRLLKILIKLIEGLLIKKCSLVVTVNDSIADEIRSMYHLPNRPLVVRNVPEYWNIQHFEIEKAKKAILQSLGMPKNTFIVMYQGLFQNNRGIENIIKAVSSIPGIALVLQGDSDSKQYLEHLNFEIENSGIKDRTLFLPFVEHNLLYQTTGAADVGMVIPLAHVKNFYYMLPNKFFECIQARTPLIVSDYPEMRGLVEKYGLGIWVDPTNIGQIQRAIKLLLVDSASRNRFAANIEKVKRQFSWENESKILREKLSDFYFECGNLHSPGNNLFGGSL